MRGVFFHLLKSTRNRRPFVQFHASTTPSPSSSFPALPNHHHLNIRPYFRSPFLSKNHISSSSSTSAAAAAATNGLRNGLISWYLGMIEARPVLTKSITAGVIFTAADVSSQVMTDSIMFVIFWAYPFLRFDDDWWGCCDLEKWVFGLVLWNWNWNSLDMLSICFNLCQGFYSMQVKVS